MNAIALTVFIGFVLVNFFVFLFLRFRKDAEASSPERDCLLPFEEEAVRVVRRGQRAAINLAVGGQGQGIHLDKGRTHPRHLPGAFLRSLAGRMRIEAGRRRERRQTSGPRRA